MAEAPGGELMGYSEWGRGRPRRETCGQRGAGGSAGRRRRGRFCRRAGAAAESRKAGGRSDGAPCPDRNVALEVCRCVTHNCTELPNRKSDNVDTPGSAAVTVAVCLSLPCSSVKMCSCSVLFQRCRYADALCVCSNG